MYHCLSGMEWQYLSVRMIHHKKGLARQFTAYHGHIQLSLSAITIDFRAATHDGDGHGGAHGAHGAHGVHGVHDARDGHGVPDLTDFHHNPIRQGGIHKPSRSLGCDGGDLLPYFPPCFQVWHLQLHPSSHAASYDQHNSQ